MATARVKTTRTVTVANPDFRTNQPEGEANQRYVQAVVSLRENSIISLAAHGALDANQVAAAWYFRKAFETVRDIKGGSLEEMTRGTRRPNGIAEKKLAAAFDLKIAKRFLGAHGYSLVATVCGEGFHIRDIYKTRRERDTATDLLRIHLTGLADVWRIDSVRS